jgi:hypothetical protein
MSLFIILFRIPECRLCIEKINHPIQEYPIRVILVALIKQQAITQMLLTAAANQCSWKNFHNAQSLSTLKWCAMNMTTNPVMTTGHMNRNRGYQKCAVPAAGGHAAGTWDQAYNFVDRKTCRLIWPI